MSLWAVLEVAIGLAFVYLLLALFATAMQELVATWFRLRRDYLWKALSDALGGAGNELFEKVLTHPLISPGVAPVAGSSSSARKENAPSYIPARNFSIAVLDFLRKFNANQTAGDIKKAIAGLPEGAVRTSLEALYADADENLEKFKQRLEIWFDDAMDRLTGVYKRWVQYFAFGFGAVAAVLFNVDSINVAKTLWLDHNMRAAMTAAAESYVKNNPAPAPNAGNQPRDARSGSAGAAPTSPCQPPRRQRPHPLRRARPTPRRTSRKRAGARNSSRLRSSSFPSRSAGPGSLRNKGRSGRITMTFSASRPMSFMRCSPFPAG
jgi:hypothetical protein